MIPQVSVNPAYELITHDVTESIYKANPILLDKFGQRGKQKCKEDNLHHLRHLQTAFELKNSFVFIDYTNWLNNLLTNRGMETIHIIDNFERLETAIIGKLEQEIETAFIHYLQEAIHVLKAL
ncbi:hypothetical protein FZW96_10730 [Bacillus sp. BGMRC 2118]|nr:hypothetical protein FZW96_10730 [Bacillus sp. BGMRC 2118]